MCDSEIAAFVCQGEHRKVKTAAGCAESQLRVPVPAILLHGNCTHCGGREGYSAVQCRLADQCHSESAEGPDLKVVLQHTSRGYVY